LDTTSHLVLVSRSIAESVAAMADTAQRTRIYRNPLDRATHTYQLDLSSHVTYLLTTDKERTMLLDLSSQAAYRLEVSQDPVYVLETASGLAFVMTTTTSKEP
jgi:hypothetical protein